MDQEQSWITIKTVGEDDNTAATNYAFFMRPEPRDNMGPIKTVFDKVLKRKIKVRDLSIGMTRNAAEENRKVVRAFLEPYPHTRIDTAKPLQGWYKSLHEPNGVRPRPCFTEAILTEPYGGWCAVGCAFSLPAGQMVDTPDGPRGIETFRVGDLVYGRTYAGRQETTVLGVSAHWKPEGLVRVSLQDGRVLLMTADHPVFSTQRGWLRAELLAVGEGLEDATMSNLRSANSKQEVLQAMLADAQSDAAQASQAVSGLRDRYPAPRVGLRQMRSCYQGSEWQESPWENKPAQGASQVCRNQSPDVRSRYVDSRGDGKEGLGSKISSIPPSQSHGRTQWDFWLQAIQTPGIYGSQGPCVSDAFHMGSFSGPVLGSTRVQLGLRTRGYLFTERACLSPRLQATAERSLHRSQRVLLAERPGEDRPGSDIGISNRDIRPEDDGAPRNPTVQKVERIQGAVQVYDIETETGNFYQQGILVHNCYVNSGFRGYRGTGLITVPLNYGEQVRQQLKKIRRGAAVYFSSFTDPFLPLEDLYHNTQEAAEACVEVGLPLFFLSRLRYPDWAVKLLQKNPHSYAQKSINTCDPEDWRRSSPGALPLEEHMKDIRRLKKAGIYISIQCNPIIPGVTSHEQIRELFKMLAKAGADHVIVKFVEAGYSWAPTMAERMIKRFGERGQAFAKLFTENIGGQRTVRESYRLNAHGLYSKYAKEVGLTYATCYEYRYERNANGDIIDKTGVSIGRDFTTADQCHGHAVPVYTRETADEKFKPVPECPPSGCLYCAAENDGKPRCGDDLAGEATALRLVDLKKPIDRS